MVISKEDCEIYSTNPPGLNSACLKNYRNEGDVIRVENGGITGNVIGGDNDGAFKGEQLQVVFTWRGNQSDLGEE